MVLSRLDYGNATLIGLEFWLPRVVMSNLCSTPLLDPSLVCRRSDHITETLASLHWLCESERIQFKLAMLGLQIVA